MKRKNLKLAAAGRKGGRVSPTNFKNNRELASRAGKRSGEVRRKLSTLVALVFVVSFYGSYFRFPITKYFSQVNCHYGNLNSCKKVFEQDGILGLSRVVSKDWKWSIRNGL